MRTLLRRPDFWIAAALLVATAGVLLLRARGPVVRMVIAERRDLEQHLVASGRVRVPMRVQIAAQLSGLVVAVGAIEGQRVKAGDLLVQLDDSTQRASVAQAEAAVKQAQARVDQLRRVGAIVATESLRQTETNLAKAELELQRTARLAQSGAVAAVELENAQRAVDIAQAQRNAAQAQQVASAPMGADSRVALTALLQVQAQLAGARAQLAQTRIVALHGGTVLARSVEPGDVVQPSRTLLEVAADSDTELVFDPDERNLAWIRIGQLAKASADAFPQQVFDARVSYIAPSIDPQRGSVEVQLDVPRPPAFLKPDMTVSIDLTIAARPNALTVPSEVVHGAATATPWVQLVERDRVVRRDVKLGIRGEGAIEIEDGIPDGSEVIVPDGRQLPSGARVRAERD
ncbi:MAG TPA: efflux RND transporter periplasmic adaptor subunit [Kofleriaceae bacterium]|nr:efflux RND transporter periplasmic adaptor subunit [Kofleriaceae bacterium]